MPHMTPSQFAEIRNDVGLSDEELSKQLGVTTPAHSEVG